MRENLEIYVGDVVIESNDAAVNSTATEQLRANLKRERMEK